MINDCKNLNNMNLIDHGKQARDDNQSNFRKIKRHFYTKDRVTSNDFCD